MVNFKLFKAQDTGPNAQLIGAKDLRLAVKNTYLKIYNAREKGDKTREDIENMTEDEIDNCKLMNRKLIKKYLLTYLKRRYTGRLSQKIASIFNWSNG